MPERTLKAPVNAAQMLSCLDSILLQMPEQKDYCPNGLQVEGDRLIRKVVTGVTASARWICLAIEAGADALLVHHGVFWKGDSPCIVGVRRQRLASILAAKLHLFAYHLPLDLHPVLGNNAQFGRRFGWSVDSVLGEEGLVASHQLQAPLSVQALSVLLEEGLQRKPLVVGPIDRQVRKVGWCTGAAQDFLGIAVDVGLDAFISGEISERTTHLARESGVPYFAAGHHATERYGVQALGDEVAHRLGVTHLFIDDDNPV